MISIIIKIAQFLVKNWKSLNAVTRWCLSNLAGTVIVNAILSGLQTTIHYLSQLSHWVITAIQHLLGL